MRFQFPLSQLLPWKSFLAAMWPLTKSVDAGILPGSGKHSVGCMDIMSDSSISGSFIRLFYPAEVPKQATGRSDYVSWLPSKEYAQGFVSFAGYTGSFTSTLFNFLTGDFKVPAVQNAPLARADSPFPVLIFSHGLGSCRTTYSSMCVEMASHGFIVGAVEHRDKSACATYIIKPVADADGDGEAPSCGRVQEWIPFLLVEGDDFEIRNNQLNTRAAECIRALDLLLRLNNGEPVINSLSEEFDGSIFKDKLDRERVGICGHSFGAATSLLTLARDKRFKCCVALDAWLFPVDKSTYADVDQPVLFVNTEKFHWPANVARMIRLVPDFDEPTDDRRVITIMGTVHTSQADLATLFRPAAARLLHLAGSLDPKLAMELNRQATVAFISAKLSLPYPVDFNKILVGDNKHVMIGTNVKLDPERIQQASL